MPSATSVFKAGNNALITGGASGIGFAMANLCRTYGMKVGIVDIVGANLSYAKEQLGSSVELFEVDVSKEDQWASLKEQVSQKLGKIDFLMLNAGTTAKGTWGDADYFKKVCS